MKNRILFPKKKDLGKRNWGKEELLVLIPKVLTLKKLFIKKGRAGGLQYHRKKNECGYLLKGKLMIKYDNGSGKLKKKLLKKEIFFILNLTEFIKKLRYQIALFQKPQPHISMTGLEQKRNMGNQIIKDYQPPK